jgi:hypothetical protein
LSSSFEEVRCAFDAAETFGICQPHTTATLEKSESEVFDARHTSTTVVLV